MKRIFFIVIIIFLANTITVHGQNKDENYAMEILNKAMGPIGEEENYSIHFEGIAYSINKPIDIFTLPAYKVYRGGYLYNDGKKFEIQLGIMKALCDGKIMVMIDESSKTMVIDSLRDKTPGDFEQAPDIQKLVDENFGDGVLSYEGIENVNNRNCHKIKASYKDQQDMHVYYWVDTEKNALLLMAEYQNKAYDVYWVKKMGHAPKGYNYKVNIPNKEVENLYGYEVYDFRFISEELRRNSVQK